MIRRAVISHPKQAQTARRALSLSLSISISLTGTHTRTHNSSSINYVRCRLFWSPVVASCTAITYHGTCTYAALACPARSLLFVNNVGVWKYELLCTIYPCFWALHAAVDWLVCPPSDKFDHTVYTSHPVRQIVAEDIAQAGKSSHDACTIRVLGICELAFVISRLLL